MYQKASPQDKKRGNKPTAAQRAKWEKVRALGCIVHDAFCKVKIDIHHALTGMGGRKDHDKVLPLCTFHHTGDGGIHKGRKKWEEKHGSEQELLTKVAKLIDD